MPDTIGNTESFGTLEVSFESNKTQLDKALNDIKSKLNNASSSISKSASTSFSNISKDFNREFSQIGRSITTIGSQLTRTFNRIGLVAGAAIGYNLFKGIKEALAVEDNKGLFTTLFGSYASTLDKINNSFAKSMRINRYELKQATIDLGVFLKGGGISDSGTLSGELAKRIYDLSAYFNFSIDKGISAVQSFLAGRNKEFLKITGIAVPKGEGIRGNLSNFMRFTSPYQGQFKAQMGDLPNQIDILVGKFKELRTDIGSKFLPVIQKLVNVWDKVNPAITKVADNLSDKLVNALDKLDFNKASESLEKFILAIGNFSDSLLGLALKYPKTTAGVAVANATGMGPALGLFGYNFLRSGYRGLKESGKAIRKGLVQDTDFGYAPTDIDLKYNSMLISQPFRDKKLDRNRLNQINVLRDLGYLKKIDPTFGYPGKGDPGVTGYSVNVKKLNKRTGLKIGLNDMESDADLTFQTQLKAVLTNSQKSMSRFKLMFLDLKFKLYDLTHFLSTLFLAKKSGLGTQLFNGMRIPNYATSISSFGRFTTAIAKLTGTFTIIIGGIVALVKIGSALNNYIKYLGIYSTLGAGLKAVFNPILEVFSSIGSFFRSLYDTVKTKLAPVVGGFKNAIKWYSDNAKYNSTAINKHNAMTIEDTANYVSRSGKLGDRYNEVINSQRYKDRALAQQGKMSWSDYDKKYNTKQYKKQQSANLAEAERKQAEIAKQIEEYQSIYVDNLKIRNKNLEDSISYMETFKDIYSDVLSGAMNFNKKLLIGAGTGYNSSQTAMTGSEIFGGSYGSQVTAGESQIVNALYNVIAAINSTKKEQKATEKIINKYDNSDMNTDSGLD